MSDRPAPVGSDLGTPYGAETVVSPIDRHGFFGVVALFWGLGGVIGLLSMAILRLLSISIDAFGFSLTSMHWLVFVVSVLFMAYAEGYRTFQKTWAPRVVRRALELKQHWTPLSLLLAPLYCMSFFRATRKRRLTAWFTTIGIVLLVIMMNRLTQPWRGLIDAGVVVGLSWGVACLVLQTFSQLNTHTNNKERTP